VLAARITWRLEGVSPADAHVVFPAEEVLRQSHPRAVARALVLEPQGRREYRAAGAPQMALTVRPIFERVQRAEFVADSSADIGEVRGGKAIGVRELLPNLDWNRV